MRFKSDLVQAPKVPTVEEAPSATVPEQPQQTEEDSSVDEED